jgi:nucleoside-diphosphate-sugar epimerase
MASYLVTGGAGFIGSHLVDALVARGECVCVFDNLSSGRRENLAGCWESIRFVEADLRDIDAVKAACQGIDYVLHHAAIASVTQSVEDPRASQEVNVAGTLNVLLAAREAGVKRVVYAASSAAYGATPAVALTEERPPQPLSPYAVSKLTGEYYAQVFSQLYGLETVSLRYFNVFGPRQDPTSQYAAVIPKFITALARGEEPVIFGDGEQTRDFVYVGNVVVANLLACTAPGAVGETINIASGWRISLNELLEVLRKVTGVPVAARYAAERPGDIKHSYADISKARKLLGYEPDHTLEEGLKTTAAWFNKAKEKE